MYVDLVKLTVESGKGGDGMVAFRREKYVDKGGPYGGTGGNGGNVVVMCDEGLSTLLELRYNKILKAPDGKNGMSKAKHGENAENLYIKVPLGTTIYDDDTNEVICDVTKNNEEFIIAKGGRGGRGNVEFATSKNPAPEICEKGEPGKVINIRAELRVLADVGLVGFPSVGKSTLISVSSAARPKIAEYHFTTIRPNLGVVGIGDRSFVMADLPGLIEGASQGAGLGHQFLRHIERTRVIIHVVDASESEGRDVCEDFDIINNELRAYNEDLLLRPQIVCANKCDLPGAHENVLKLRKHLEGQDIEVVEVSSFTKEGVNDLLYKTADLLEVAKHQDFLKKEQESEMVEYNFDPNDVPFTIELADDNVFVVKGEVIEKMVRMADFTKEESIRRFSRALRQLGVDAKLRELGVRHGDTVRVFDFEFEFYD